jgi:hypothetical protein
LASGTRYTNSTQEGDGRRDQVIGEFNGDLIAMADETLYFRACLAHPPARRHGPS